MGTKHNKVYKVTPSAPRKLPLVASSRRQLQGICKTSMRKTLKWLGVSMTVFSIKKIESQIHMKNISMASFIFYTFISISSAYTLSKTTRYEVIKEAYNIASVFLGMSSIITILKYFWCYKIVKNINLTDFAYAVIPINAVLSLRYVLFFMLPLVILNIQIIKIAELNFAYWNVINSSIISLVYAIVFTISFLKSIRRVFDKKHLDITV